MRIPSDQVSSCASAAGDPVYGVPPIDVREGAPVFIQVNITHSDHSIEEFTALEDEFLKLTEGERTIQRAIACVGADDPSLRVLIAIFPDADAAARNSALPGTDQIAQKVMAMSKGEPQFINLNVVSDRSF